MPFPVLTTEQGLAEYMEAKLRDLGDVPGWSAAAMSYELAVWETLLEYGVPDITQATDPRKLTTLAEVMALRAALIALAPVFDASDEGQSQKRSQMYAHAADLLTRAEQRAVDIGAMGPTDDSRRPVLVELTTTAPVNAPLPGDPAPYPNGPDANDPRYAGSPYHGNAPPWP